MGLNINQTIDIEGKTLEIFDRDKLYELISQLTTKPTGSFSGSYHTLKQKYRGIDENIFEHFVFFSWVIVLRHKAAIKNKLVKAIDKKELEYFIEKFTSSNPYYAKEIQNTVCREIDAFLEFHNQVVEYTSQLMLLRAWTELFTNVDADMNAVRDISIGSITGYKKIITKAKLTAVGFTDNRRMGMGLAGYM